MLKYLPNMLACQVSILHDAQGPNNSITQSDVASVLALGETFRLLCRDRGDFFLAGGAESRINILSLTRNSLFEELSTDNQNPQKACRPFDKKDRKALRVMAKTIQLAVSGAQCAINDSKVD
ncbi:hypothetical protein EBX93_11290, partial [bacterium]|nr:hypothetical protein [bacterium]